MLHTVHIPQQHYLSAQKISFVFVVVVTVHNIRVHAGKVCRVGQGLL